MLVTHSLKLTNPRSNNSGLISHSKPINGFLSNASALEFSKKYWAAPTNAADMPAAKVVADLANDNDEVAEYFPESLSVADKQMFLKTKEGYVLHTPAIGCALVDAVNSALTAIKATWINHQPTVAAWGNHGEIMVKNHGRLRVVDVGEDSNREFTKRFKSTDGSASATADTAPAAAGNYVFLKITGQLQSFNANAGLISVGIPAMTAIAGTVDHLIFNAKSKDTSVVKFAIGLKNSRWSSSNIKGTNSTRDVASKATIPFVNFSEKRGDCAISLIISAPINVIRKIRKYTKNHAFKLAGGDLFDVNISYSRNGFQNNDEYEYLTQYGEYSVNAIEELVEAAQNRVAFPLQVGFRLLEQPKARKGRRDLRKNHAFSEPIYLPCSFTRQPVFWYYDFNDGFGVSRVYE